ncbi:MAG: TrmH family RNA methyltransferase [Acidimicrobiia bacterium]
MKTTLATKREVRSLRALARDPKARRAANQFLVEGPRVVGAALDRSAPLVQVLCGPGARAAFPALMERLELIDVPVVELREGALERIATTRTPQPVLAVAPISEGSAADLPAEGHVIVVVDVADPGNAGALLRSAEASGAAGIVLSGNSVDAYNPKVVRASAGAIFGVPVVEEDDPVSVLDQLAAAGRRRLGAVPSGGLPYERAPLAEPVAIVLGGEARGLTPEVAARLDGTVSIPMAGATESLNVAMAATVLAFEARRQRSEQ